MPQNLKKTNFKMFHKPRKVEKHCCSLFYTCWYFSFFLYWSNNPLKTFFFSFLKLSYWKKKHFFKNPKIKFVMLIQVIENRGLKVFVFVRNLIIFLFKNWSLCFLLLRLFNFILNVEKHSNERGTNFEGTNSKIGYIKFEKIIFKKS